MSLKTLRCSHAKNCKAQKIKEPPKIQEEEIQPTSFLKESPPERPTRAQMKQQKYASLFQRAF